MGKKLSLTQVSDYEKTQVEIADYLDEQIEILEQYITNLATQGKWKEWSDSQPVGAIFTFTEEMMRNTGDKNIDMLNELCDSMWEIRDKIDNKLARAKMPQKHDEIFETEAMQEQEWQENIARHLTTGEQEIDKCTVLMYAHEMQCCGTPFGVGDLIDNWAVCKYECDEGENEDENDKEELPAGINKVDFLFEGHFRDWPYYWFEMHGKVTNIVAVHHAEKQSETHTLTVNIKKADGWGERIKGKELSRYYIGMENVSLRPIRPSGDDLDPDGLKRLADLDFK